MGKRRILEFADLKIGRQPLLRSMNETSDLGCVLLGTSFLEHSLGRILANRFVGDSTPNALLQPGGPIGDLGTRSKMAYVLGLMSKSMMTEIIYVAEIRNQFAHNF